MAERSSIQWTHHTFNPWSGCAKVHTGCTRCYAEKLPPSMRRNADWGEVWLGGKRVVASEDYWRQPLAWARTAARAGERQRVFCASTADVLEVPGLPPVFPRGWSEEKCTAARACVFETGRDLNRARHALWDVIRQTVDACPRCGLTPQGPCEHQDALGPGDWPGLDWLLLTKRPENWRLVPEDVRPRVWLGTSVSDQQTCDRWGAELMRAPGFGLRFLSVEPLVGPVDLSPLLDPVGSFCCGGEPEFCHCLDGWQWGSDGWRYARPDWVIVGGESGRQSRPCQVEWVRDLVRQCREAEVPCFVKQLGAHYVDAENAVGGVQAQPPDEYGSLTRRLADKKGGDPAEWPEDLRVRELPEVARV